MDTSQLMKSWRNRQRSCIIIIIIIIIIIQLTRIPHLRIFTVSKSYGPHIIYYFQDNLTLLD
jgi:branched-subunit amino acid transport protein AzlD